MGPVDLRDRRRRFPLIVSEATLGYEWGSYAWRGYGTWTQLWGMWLLPFAWGLSWRAIAKGRSYWLAALVLALTVACHLLTGYLALLSLGVFALVKWGELLRRIGRAALVGLGSLFVAAWVVVPLLADRLWTVNDEYSRGKIYYDSFGARRILGWFASGELFDRGRPPMVTILVAVGLVVALWRYRRDERARVLLFLFLVSLFLFFGRPTLGPVLRLLPGSGDLFLRRFVFGVHLAGLYLAGFGAVTLAADRAGAAPSVPSTPRPTRRDRRHRCGSRRRLLRTRLRRTHRVGRAGSRMDRGAGGRRRDRRRRRGRPGRHRAGAWAGQVLRGDACQLGVVVRRRSGAGLRHAPEPGDRRRRFRQADVVALGAVRVPLHRYEPVALRPVRRAVPDPRRGEAAAGPGGAGGRARAPRAVGDAGPELRRPRRRPPADHRGPDEPGAARGQLVPLGSPGPGGEPRRRVRGASGARTDGDRRRPPRDAGRRRDEPGRRSARREGDRDRDRRAAGHGDAQGLVRPALAGHRRRHPGRTGDDRAELRRANGAGRRARGSVRLRAVPALRPAAAASERRRSSASPCFRGGGGAEGRVRDTSDAGPSPRSREGFPRDQGPVV